MALKLTDEDHARLRDKRLANIIRKLNSGKTPAAREQAILDSSRSPAAGEAPSMAGGTAAGYASTWDDLAAALKVEERTLYNFRQKHAAEIKRLSLPPLPRAQRLTAADGTHHVANWRAFADEVGELKGRGLNNPACAAIDERQLRLEERTHDLARAKHKLQVEIGEVLKLTEFQAALRITVGAFDAALKQIPGRAAERVVEAARQAMLTLLRAHLTPAQFTKLSALLEHAPLDHAAITQILEDEIEAPRRVLREADFMQAETSGEKD